MHFGEIMLVLAAILLSGGVIGATLFGRKMLQLVSTRTSTQIVVEKAKLDEAKHRADIARHGQTIALAKMQAERQLEAGPSANPEKASDETEAEEAPEVVKFHPKKDVSESFPRLRNPFRDSVMKEDIEDGEYT